MKNIILILIITLSVLRLNAQYANIGSKELDNRLYNGKYYDYFLPSNVSGNQFFSSKKSSIGIVWKKGVGFDNILLNYDVLNQELVLEFNSNDGALKLISLSMVDVDSFYFDNKKFIIDTNISSLGSIYQCINYNGIKFYFYFTKYLKLQSKLSDIEYHFNKLQKSVYFYYEGKIYEVKRISSFMKKVNPKIASDVKHYIKSKKYKMKKMTDEQYLDLLVYIKDKAIE